jgi:hypothetical protein
MSRTQQQQQQHEPLEMALEEGYRWVQEGGLRRMMDRAPVRIPGLPGIPGLAGAGLGSGVGAGVAAGRGAEDRREAAVAYELEEGRDRDERGRRQE